MKIDGLSNKASRFEGANFELRQSTDGVLVHIVEMDNWLRVMIEVKDTTTHDQLRDVIPLALEWRDRLIEWQGHWTVGGNQGLLETMHQQHSFGERSYSQIAENLNQQIAELLFENKAWQEEYFAVRESFKTMGDFNLHRWSHNRFAIGRARFILETMRFPDSEIDEILSEGFKRIMNGEPPFEKEFPISRDKVIHILRVWRRKRSKPNESDTID